LSSSFAYARSSRERKLVGYDGRQSTRRRQRRDDSGGYSPGPIFGVGENKKRLSSHVVCPATLCFPCSCRGCLGLLLYYRYHLPLFLGKNDRTLMFWTTWRAAGFSSSRLFFLSLPASYVHVGFGMGSCRSGRAPLMRHQIQSSKIRMTAIQTTMGQFRAITGSSPPCWIHSTKYWSDDPPTTDVLVPA